MTAGNGLLAFGWVVAVILGGVLLTLTRELRDCRLRLSSARTQLARAASDAADIARVQAAYERQTLSVLKQELEKTLLPEELSTRRTSS